MYALLLFLCGLVAVGELMSPSMFPTHLSHSCFVPTALGSYFLGCQVEMRRWLTFTQAGGDLDKLWHRMLLAVTASSCFEGRNPWEHTPLREAHEGPEDPHLSFKAEALRILKSSFHQSALRSILIVASGVQMLQAQCMADVPDPGATTKFALDASHLQTWISVAVHPMARHALFSHENLAYVGLGLCGDIEAFPGSARLGTGALPEDQELLLMHLTLTMEHAWQLILFGALPQSPPWSFIRLLHPSQDVVKAALDDMKEVWDLVLSLEASRSPLERDFLKILFMTTWVSFREVMLLFESNGWKPCELGLQYVHALNPGFCTSVPLEWGFNSLRDMERRGARHAQRSPPRMQSCFIQMLESRFHDMAQPEVTPEHLTRLGRVQVRAETFLAEKGPRTEADLGIPIEHLKDAGFSGTSWSVTPQHLAVGQCALLRALLRVDRESWANMWLATLIKPHTVLATPAGEVYYAFGVTKWSVWLWHMADVGEGFYCFDDKADAISEAHCINLEAFMACTWTLSLLSGQRSEILITTQDPEDIIRHRLRLDAKSFTLTCLRKVFRFLGLAPPKGKDQTSVAWIEGLLDHYDDITFGEMDLIRQEAEEARKRRAQPLRKTGDEEGGEEDFEDTEALRELVSPALQQLAPREIDFLLGKLPGGEGLGEEELDEGLSVQADRALAKATNRTPSSSSARPAGSQLPEESQQNLPPIPPQDVEGKLRVPGVPADDVPPGCTLRQYTSRDGATFWEAKLPQGVYVRGCNSCSRRFHPALRSEETAKAEVYEFLQSAELEVSIS
jgi:hypothetical protein